MSMLKKANIRYGVAVLKDCAAKPPVKGPRVMPSPKKVSTKPNVAPTWPFEASFEAIDKVKGPNIPIEKPSKAKNAKKYPKPAYEAINNKANT